MNVRIRQISYVVLDLISAAAGWFGFFLFRKNIIEAAKHGYEIPVGNDAKLGLGIVLIPICWVLFYAATGFYREPFRRSRLRDAQNTFFTSGLGVLAIFFVLILDDSVTNYKDYYVSVSVYFLLHFIPTLLLRTALTTQTASKIQHRIWGFNTLLVGAGPSAGKLYRELMGAKKSEGFYIQGYLHGNHPGSCEDLKGLSDLGKWDTLPQTIKEHQIEDVIICLEEEEHGLVPSIAYLLQNEQVHVKIMPDSYGLMMGMVKMNNILGAMLMEVDFEVMPQWQKTAKRIFDLVSSSIALILTFPLMAAIALAIKWSSKGPVFFTQERIGYKGRPFRIIKFRTMKTDAEKEGPQLSREDDPRITGIGRLLRKTRLDELPQFYNVLKGDMSIVGPRPERQYFIDQIVKRAPYYLRLHRIKPGITSWGQVKFGYAENVDQMVDRLKYDMLYLENMSLALDLKIIIYTALIMVQGRGK